MGLLNKIFSYAADELKKSLEETKKEMRNNLEEMKQNAKAGFIDSASKYARKLKDYEARLREMPGDKVSFYGGASERIPVEKTVECSDANAVKSNDDHPTEKETAFEFMCKLRGELVKAYGNKSNSTEAYSTYSHLAQQYKSACELYRKGERSAEKIKEAIQLNLDKDAGKSNNDSAFQITAKKENNDNGGFSSRMEALISASLQDGVLTDQEKAVLKKRAEKEGEDWDEVEMIIEARLAEMQPSIPKSNTETLMEQKVITEINDEEELPDDEEAALANATAEKDYTEEVGAEAMQSLSQADETDISSTQETVVEASEEANGRGLIVYDNGETEVLSADCKDAKKIPFSFHDIVKIIFPSGIKRIGEHALNDYDLLEEVDCSKCSELEIIEEHAFECCKELKVVDLSGCVELKVIDTQAFSHCANLESLIISQCKKLERIGSNAFYNNKLLKKVVFPASIKSIDDYAFSECSLEEIDFSQCLQLESIDSYAFSGSQLRQVVFPASLKEISDAFVECEKLEILDFSSCTQLEYVHSKLVRGSYNIKVLDFSNCEKLNLSPLAIRKDFEKIILPPGQTSFNAMCIWDQLGYNIDKSLCHFQHIKKEAFSGWEQITEMEIPDSIEEIGKDAFKNCSQLKTLIMPASLKKMESLGSGLERLKKLDFSKVTQLKNIPENVISYDCPKLRELTIPNGVVEIEDDAFSNASNLRTLFLPPTLEEMGELGLWKLDIYCFSPAIEELTPLIVAIFDNDEEEDEEEMKRIDSPSYCINLFVLPQYLEKYIAQRNAERISKDVLVIQAIPDEYLYYYDN